MVNLRDSVITLDGSRESSFGQLLDKFVRLKACRCGNVCSVVQTGELGEFVLFEVDRALSGDDNSKEIVLYPLQLEQVRFCGLYTRVGPAVGRRLSFVDGKRTFRVAGINLDRRILLN